MSASSDKRKSKRAECSVPLEIETVSGSYRDQSIITNCSTDGLCFNIVPYRHNYNESCYNNTELPVFYVE